MSVNIEIRISIKTRVLTKSPATCIFLMTVPIIYNTAQKALEYKFEELNVYILMYPQSARMDVFSDQMHVSTRWL